ncbi:MAG: hypothetical protein IKV53_07270 [Clostridia bacterium]|nr:hypothetical protein [Clostridia bacterium]
MPLFTSKKAKIPTPKEYEDGRIYDYSSREGRIATAEWLFNQAKSERSVKEAEWKKHEDYYNNAHDTALEIKDAREEMGVPWTPTCVPDPYIMVESQIIPDIPQPEFHGRDDDRDSLKAKIRELAVKYIIETNRLEEMNTANERRLRKLGDAWWKAYYDDTMPFGHKNGNIRIKDISPADIYPDPTARSLDDCEYIDHVYSMHKNKFWRTFYKELKAQGLTLDDITSAYYTETEGVLDIESHATTVFDDTVQILEHWFRQPYDTTDAPAGAIACSIQVSGIEVKYIPNYWENTWRQCNLYPFVQYWCIRDENSFYNRSELEPIIPLVDTADRELATGLLNDAMTANDVVLVEEGTLVEGETFSNVPGAVNNVKQGRLNGIARLGGLGSGVKSIGMVEWAQNQMQRASRNYDTNNGRETSRVTTASGLLQLRSDADRQGNIKKSDRDSGFRRLYELLDWLALEFWDEDMYIFIGAKSANEAPREGLYNSNNIARIIPGHTDLVTEESITEDIVYYPVIDVTITTGNGLSKNPATTVEVLDKLAAITVTEDNWKILAAELEYLDIPQKQDIIASWKKKFEPDENELSPEIIDALKSNTELKAALEEIVAQSSMNQAPEIIPGGVPLDIPVSQVQDMPISVPTVSDLPI